MVLRTGEAKVREEARRQLNIGIFHLFFLIKKLIYIEFFSLIIIYFEGIKRF